ncbi:MULTISPECIES: DUF805 domain-containing protein [Staphylococcus]|uniref:DUF805 domain-containing protein n=1 Tax=Staphylococcus agnetis TaxID=985762 RepID=A0A2T4MEK1_9STAP|nr:MULTISPECIES: DUF805 domain-containing protein [Staphylococcus]MDG4944478.1 DUF805 domain-containing protein [Staphylococcus agnetis]NHM92618.1 DUF805 domain-containing protein [Staphylococcus sp. 10602379]NJI01771.1 DUF805 domain-containing protein [Staphylococcus agnetis]NJI12877.1 DUF805 domain-containing protein [Staphylococcus agnetis]PTH14235.1 DUF805 domain-containing protein [Staphylococcus agnetis]
MNRTQNVLSCYKLFWTRAFDYHGRSTRKEFWHPFWINLVISFLLARFTHNVVDDIFSLIIFVPTLTVMARRLHDKNRTMLLAVILNVIGLGATILDLTTGSFSIMSNEVTPMVTAYITALAIFTVIVFILTIYVIVLMCTKGDEKPNKYGDGGTYRLLNPTTTTE